MQDRQRQTTCNCRAQEALYSTIIDNEHKYNKPKSLLSSSIPNLQLDDFASNIDKLATKLNTNSVCGILLNYIHITPFTNQMA